jgi:hypothetical protein
VQGRTAATLRLASVLAGLFLIGLQLLPEFFALPAAAANLDPFDVRVFVVKVLEPRPLRSLLTGIDGPGLLLSLGILLAIYAVARTTTRPAASLGSLWRRLVEMPERRFVGGIAAAQFLLSSLLAFLVFDAMPHVQDEIGQFFQARIFASGRLYARPFAYPDFFSFYSVIQTDKWYSHHPPGFPLLLAPFLRLGVPALLDPLLGAGCTVLVHRLGNQLYGRRTGRLAALLLLLSPFHAFMSASFMNHTLTLFLLLVVATIAVDRRASALRVGLAGAALGGALMTRPLVSVVVGSALVLVGLSRRRAWGERLGLLVALSAGVLAPLAFFLWSNFELNGSPFLLSYAAADAAYVRLGFEHALVPYTPVTALVKTAQLFRGLSRHLFAWPVSSLLLVWVFLVTARARRRDLLLLAVGLTAPFAYFFYWFQDMCMGPRFAYESIPVWVLLTARAVTAARPASRGVSRPLLAGVVVLASVWSLTQAWPDLVRGYGASYWGVDRRLTRTAEAMGLAGAIVLVNEEACPWYYGSGFWANSPTLDGDVVYARDLGATAARRLLEGFPGRDLYLYDCAAGRLVAVTLP